MQTVIDPGEVARVATSGRGAATPLRLTTTLYALMAALQAVVAPADDARVVATVTHLLRSRRLTWLRTDSMRRGPFPAPDDADTAARLPPSRCGKGRSPRASLSLRPRQGEMRACPCEEGCLGWQLLTSGR